MAHKPSIIFDIEGTLIDCIPQTIAAWRDVLAEDGQLFADNTLHRFSGMDGDLMLKQLLPQSTTEHRKALIKRQGQRYRQEYLPKVKAFAGVAAVFAAIAGGRSLALA